MANMYIMSVYNPRANRDCESFKADVNLLSAIPNSYFLCGDFNARHRLWNCQAANRMGKTLFETLQRGNFSIHHPQNPTYFPSDENRNPSTIPHHHEQ